MMKTRFALSSSILALCLITTIFPQRASAINSQNNDQYTDVNSDNLQQKNTDKQLPRALTASELNARQRIKQTLTVKRTLNGEVIEEKTVIVPDNIAFPEHETEVGITISEYVRASVDREVLTRREVLSEADIDFTLADINIDGAMTRDEYANLWGTRQYDENYKNIIKQNEENPHTSELLTLRITAMMGEKFDFMCGMQASLSRKEYITEVLRDFDSMDANGDYILRDKELENFRAVSIGMRSK